MASAHNIEDLTRSRISQVLFHVDPLFGAIYCTFFVLALPGNELPKDISEQDSYVRIYSAGTHTEACVRMLFPSRRSFESPRKHEACDVGAGVLISSWGPFFFEPAGGTRL